MKRYLPFVIILVVAVVGIGGAWALMRDKTGGPTTNSIVVNSSPGGAESAPTEAPIVKPSVKIHSPVVLEEFGDYQCPPCGLLFPELKKIEGEYGDQLKIVFHHFPLTKMHKNALTAAHAAEAARNQGKFPEMHDRLYGNQKTWAEDDNARAVFISYARELGLNVDRFVRDLDSPEVDQRVNHDFQLGTARGVTGTPTVFIDGQMLRYEATTPEGLRRGINMMIEQRALKEQTGT